jgi:hypothetical protein
MSLIAVLLALAAPQAADRQAAFARQQFADAGFGPMAERAEEGRQVRRLLLFDPYGMAAVPAAAIERERDGRVTLTIRYRRWQTDPVALSPTAWAELKALEVAAFAPPPVTPPRDPGAPILPPPPPPPICHGWFARMAADGDRLANWAACGGKDDARLAYLSRFVAIALATRPSCPQGGSEDAFWSYRRCFAQGSRLDDAALDARFAPLVAEWEALPGSDRLMEARMSLRAAQDAPLGSPPWLAARDAVAKFKVIQDRRRSMLNDLRVINGAGRQGSPGDRARIGEAMEGWASWIPSQDANYIELANALIWPQAAISAPPVSPATRR